MWVIVLYFSSVLFWCDGWDWWFCGGWVVDWLGCWFCDCLWCLVGW